MGAALRYRVISHRPLVNSYIYILEAKGRYAPHPAAWCLHSALVPFIDHLALDGDDSFIDRLIVIRSIDRHQIDRCEGARCAPER